MAAAAGTAPSTPRLSEVARHLVYPAGIVSTGWPRIERRLADMAIEFDGWQQGAAQLILGHDANGRYAATIGGVTMSIPRQVGKTFTVGSLLVAMCLEYPGLRVVWTSHHLRTTTNTFRAMQAMVRKKRVLPHLAHNGIRTANGEQEIKFANGSIIMFGAREHGFGVGIDAIDVLVCDEAQRLSSRALADMVPTTNQSRHRHGALVFFIGTPPRPDNDGDEFANRREKALDGRMTNGIYVEFSADRGADLSDPVQWAKANPSYPHRTPHESMLRLRENLTDDGDWSREAMGIWDEAARQLALIPADLWDERAGAGPGADEPPTAIGLDRWHDGTTAVCGAWRLDEDRFHVELLAFDVTTDTTRVVDWVAEMARKRIPVLAVADSPAAAMIPDLVGKRVKAKVVSQADFSRGCQAFVNDGIDGTLQHAGQEQLADALAGAVQLPVGKAGAWVLDRRSPDNDISSLVAAVVARHGATTAKKRRSGGVVTA